MPTAGHGVCDRCLLFGDRPGDGFGLQVLIEAGLTILTADTTELIPTEGNINPMGGTAVNGHNTGSNPARHGP